MSGVLAQSGAKNGEWRAWAGDVGATRYAPLDQINASNFNTLEIAWRFRTDNLGKRPDFNLQTTPLMINGVLYATAGEHRNAVAINAANGELLWMHRLEEGRRADASVRRLSGRGVGVPAPARGGGIVQRVGVRGASDCLSRAVGGRITRGSAPHSGGGTT